MAKEAIREIWFRVDQEVDVLEEMIPASKITDVKLPGDTDL